MLELRLDIYSRLGELKAMAVPYVDIAYKKVVNEVGILQVTLSQNDPSLQYLEDEAQLLVYACDKANNIPWQLEFVAIYDSVEITYSTLTTIKITCPSIMTMLSWRINDYGASVANKTVYTAVPAETIMKSLVANNFSASATVANGRTINATDSRIVVSTDLAQGNAITRGNANNNILAELQYLSSIAGGDFDLVKTGASQFTFNYYQGQLGTNRSSNVIFSLKRGNVNNMVYTRNRMPLKTVAIAKGVGNGTDRIKQSVTGNGYTSAYHREVFVDATNTGVTSELTSKANAALDAAKLIQTFEFDVLQSPSTLYLRDYFLGDIVSAEHEGIQLTKKVKSVSVSATANNPTAIAVELI